MRDINRIDRYCNKLCELWKLQPDLRFSQLISNYLSYRQSDCYYTEDADFFNGFEEYANKYLRKIGDDDNGTDPAWFFDSTNATTVRGE